MQSPENYAETPDGHLYIADGLNPMTRWDGAAASTVPVGVTAPAAAPTLTASGAGTITGTYYGYVRFLDELGAWSDLSPVSAACVAASNSTVTYTNVPTSAQVNVQRRQLLRNTSGQATTFYVDVDTADLVSTTFTSTQTDGQVAAGLAVPLFDAQGRILANTNGVPPAHKAALAYHLGRMFAGVQRDYTAGSVSVTNGSAAVTGVGTAWTAPMAGRFLYVDGATASYQILSVNVAAQTLTLAATYADLTNQFGTYAIRPAPAERRLIYYTEAGRPESWPAFDALSLQEDGDEITGLFVMGSFLFIVERRHVYRFTFQDDPAVDGFVFLSGNRGCVNQRCICVVEGSAYMLDESGVHAFDGGESDPVSVPIQQTFFPYDAAGRVNWNAADYFHAAHSPAEQVIRWFVALSGEYLPRHALAYNYRDKRWWVEEFSRPVGCSALGTWQGQRRVYHGTNAFKTLLYAAGRLDGPDPTAGVTRATLTGATSYTFTDAVSQWPASGLVNFPVVIVSGRGEGQLRTVYKVVGQTGYVRTPWAVLPDATSVYQLGGVPWSYQTGWFRWDEDEETEPRRVEVQYEPAAHAATMAVQLFNDFSGVPYVWRRTRSAQESEGMAMAAGSPDLQVDLTDQSGLAQQRFDGHRELYIRGNRYVSVGLSGVAGQDLQAVYQLAVDGARRP